MENIFLIFFHRLSTTEKSEENVMIYRVAVKIVFDFTARKATRTEIIILNFFRRLVLSLRLQKATLTESFFISSNHCL